MCDYINWDFSHAWEPSYCSSHLLILQTLAIYDRFGRLMLGSEEQPKDVLEYLVLERHLVNPYGCWRLHGKIVPSWAPAKDPIIKVMLTLSTLLKTFFGTQRFRKKEVQKRFSTNKIRKKPNLVNWKSSPHFNVFKPVDYVSILLLDFWFKNVFGAEILLN